MTNTPRDPIEFTRYRTHDRAGNRVQLEDQNNNAIVWSNGSIPTAPIGPLLEGGLTTIIGINDAAMATNTYSNSVGVTLPGTYSGEILSVMLYSSGGAIITPDSELFVFDADPSVSAGDASVSLAGRRLELGSIQIAEGDWDSDANAGSVFEAVAVPFHALSTLFFVFKNLGATTINSAGGDDELFEFNFWIRRDS